MRAFLKVSMFAALALVPALAVAAPRTIDDCETIDAADAYNRCLALFGPPGRSLRLDAAVSDVGAQDAVSVTRAEPSVPPSQHGRHAWRSARHDSGRAYASRHRPGHHATVTQRHIHAKRMVFNVVSGHTRVR